jgi:hypothetical protein
VTLSPYEMGTLIAAARWVLEGGEGELTDEARSRLQQVLESYDEATRRLNEE